MICGLSRHKRRPPTWSGSGMGMARALLRCSSAVSRACGLDRRDAVLVEEAQLDQAGGALLNRVALGPLLHHFAGHVVGRVVLGVAVHAHGDGLDEGRAIPARARATATRGGLVHSEHVDAVHPLAGHPVRDGLGREVGGQRW